MHALIGCLTFCSLAAAAWLVAACMAGAEPKREPDWTGAMDDWPDEEIAMVAELKREERDRRKHFNS